MEGGMDDGSLLHTVKQVAMAAAAVVMQLSPHQRMAGTAMGLVAGKAAPVEDGGVCLADEARIDDVLRKEATELAMAGTAQLLRLTQEKMLMARRVGFMTAQAVALVARPMRNGYLVPRVAGDAEILHVLRHQEVLVVATMRVMARSAVGAAIGFMDMLILRRALMAA